MRLDLRSPNATAILAAIFVGVGGAVGVQAANVINPIVLASLASLLAPGFLLAISFVVRARLQIRDLLKTRLGDTLAIVFSRFVIGSTLLLIGFSLSTNFLRPLLLLLLEPVFVLIWTRVLLRNEKKNRIRPEQIILIIVVILGTSLVLTNGNLQGIAGNLNLGDVLVISSLVLFSYSYVPLGRVVKNISSLTVSITSQFLGGIILLPVAYISIVFNLFNVNDLATSSSIYNWTFFLISYILLFPVLAIYFYISAMEKKVEDWIVSALITSLGPIAGAVLLWQWLGMTLETIEIGGAIIALTASSLIVVSRERNIMKMLTKLK